MSWIHFAKVKIADVKWMWRMDLPFPEWWWNVGCGFGNFSDKLLGED